MTIHIEDIEDNHIVTVNMHYQETAWNTKWKVSYYISYCPRCAIYSFIHLQYYLFVQQFLVVLFYSIQFNHTSCYIHGRASYLSPTDDFPIVCLTAVVESSVCINVDSFVQRRLD